MTRFIYLSQYNNSGYPLGINVDEFKNDIKQSVSNEFVAEVNNTLPGGVTVVDKNPDWIRKSDLIIVDDCEILVTFVTEGAGYKNALAYYVYDIDSPPNRFGDVETIYIIFPNASKTGGGGLLNPGDTMKIAYESLTTETINGKEFLKTGNYTFPKNVGVGFVCMSNQWRNNGRASAYLNVNHGMYSSDPALNPEKKEELKHHSINFVSEVNPSRVVYGFEDLKRDVWSDHDFNDLVYFVTPSPISAVATASTNSTTKQSHQGYILCEDIKNGGDFDYNDLTLRYNITELIDSDKKITELSIEVQGLHRGASYNHDFGVIIANIKNMGKCKILRETYITSTGDGNKQIITSSIVGGSTDKVPIIENTKKYLPGDYTNTLPDSTPVLPSYTILKIIFPEGVARTDLMMPYRFYLDVYNAKNQLKHTMYSDEEYATSQKAQLAGVFTKLKIMVIQNCTSFKSPIEKKKLHKAYPKFMKHLKNKLTNRNWYSVQHANHSLLKNEIIHTNVKVWELSVDKQMSVGGIVMHPTSFTPFTFTNSGVMESIELNNISAEHIVDWSTITSSNVNSLITLISKHGTCHVTNASIYISGIEIGKGFLYYYIAIAENSINPSRIIHDTIQGDNHVLELLSSTEKQSYVACLLGD